MERTAGIRHTKEHLSSVLKDVQRGHEWVICERGKPIARIVPIRPEDLSVDEQMERLIARGWITRSEPGPAIDFDLPVAEGGDIAQRYLQEDRGD